MLCDVKTSYVLRVMPYLGKTDHPDDVGVAEHVNLTLMDSYHKTGLNVTTDNIFTSITTAKKFLRHDITTAGTLRSNKRKIPRELLHDSPKLPIHSPKFFFGKDDRKMIAFYKDKQKNNVFLQSSMHMSPSVDETEAKKKTRGRLVL